MHRVLAARAGNAENTRYVGGSGIYPYAKRSPTPPDYFLKEALSVSPSPTGRGQG